MVIRIAVIYIYIYIFIYLFIYLFIYNSLFVDGKDQKRFFSLS